MVNASAIQLISLALAVLIVALLIMRRRRKKGQENKR